MEDIGENYSRINLIEMLKSMAMQEIDILKLKRKDLITLYNNVQLKQIKKIDDNSLISESDVYEEISISRFSMEIAANEHITESNCRIKRETLNRFSTNKKCFNSERNSIEINNISSINANSNEESKGFLTNESLNSNCINIPFKFNKMVDKPLIELIETPKTEEANYQPVFKQKIRKVSTKVPKHDFVIQTSQNEMTFAAKIDDMTKDKELKDLIKNESNSKLKEKTVSNDIIPNIINYENILYDKKDEVIIENPIENSSEKKQNKSRVKSNHSEKFPLPKIKLNINKNTSNDKIIKMDCPLNKNNFFLNSNFTLNSNNKQSKTPHNEVENFSKDKLDFNYYIDLSKRRVELAKDKQIKMLKEETINQLKSNMTKTPNNDNSNTSINIKRDIFNNSINLRNIPNSITNYKDFVYNLTPVPNRKRPKENLFNKEQDSFLNLRFNKEHLIENTPILENNNNSHSLFYSGVLSLILLGAYLIFKSDIGSNSVILIFSLAICVSLLYSLLLYFRRS